MVDVIEPFPPVPEHDPANALQINYSRPVSTDYFGEDERVVTHGPGPYARIVVQGDAKYVELIHRFLGVELQWMWDDIARERAVERERHRKG